MFDSAGNNVEEARFYHASVTAAKQDLIISPPTATWGTSLSKTLYSFKKLWNAREIRGSKPKKKVRIKDQKRRESSVSKKKKGGEVVAEGGGERGRERESTTTTTT